jgi:hypothetical protein
MRTRILLLTAATFALTGCSTPLVTPEPPTIQHEMTYLRDWEALASRTAANFTDTFSDHNQPVFVSPGPSDMPFAISYRKYLEKELLERGVPVRESAAGAMVLSFDVQTFIHRGDHNKTPLDYLLFYNPIDGSFAFDGFGKPDPSSPTLFNDAKFEVVLTLTVMNGVNVAHRDMRRFYVGSNDLAFYWTRLGDFIPQAKAINAPEVPLPIHGGYR